MKSISILLTSLVFLSCNTGSQQSKELQGRVDSLEKKLAETYKPGLGEFMVGIQLHHAKLWLAGQNQNWPLADMELMEIRESLEAIQKYCTDRPEIKAIGMIDLPLDSLNHAVMQKDPGLFKTGFTLLTNTCNSCHKATGHEYNVIIVPVGNPVVNQDFRPAQ